MTLTEAIAEVKTWYRSGPRAEDIIIRAVQSGDLIPKADAEMAVALAYQRACEPVEANFPGTLYASNRTKAIAAILALAPADALAEVERMRKERDGLRRQVRHMVPISVDGNYVFIDGPGDIEIDHGGKLRARAEDAEAEVARLGEALGRIVEWSDAYPTQVFPEPDFARAAAALSAAGLSLDVVAASNMRYATKGCGEIARAALKGDTP